MKIIRNNRDKIFWSYWCLWFFLSCILIGIYKFESIVVHSFFIIVFGIIVLLDNTNKKFSNWLDQSVNKSTKYKLSIEETILWKSIQQKAQNGFVEYNSKDDKENCMGCWVSPKLTKEESELLDKIHEYFYPGDYIVDPVGASQANYIWYEDVKDKVSYE